MRVYSLMALLLLFSATPHWYGGSRSWGHLREGCPEGSSRTEEQFGDISRISNDCITGAQLDRINHEEGVRMRSWTGANCPICWLDYL